VAGEIVRPGVSLRFNDLARKILSAYPANQYFSKEIVGDVKSGAGVKRTGELYGHEKGEPVRNRKSNISSFLI
jgi:hypothetical protein